MSKLKLLYFIIIQKTAIQKQSKEVIYIYSIFPKIHLDKSAISPLENGWEYIKDTNAGSGSHNVRFRLVRYQMLYSNEPSMFPMKAKNLNESFYHITNSISFAFTEICGRNYGGGALELLPKETGNILVPI